MIRPINENRGPNIWLLKIITERFQSSLQHACTIQRTTSNKFHKENTQDALIMYLPSVPYKTCRCLDKT